MNNDLSFDSSYSQSAVSKTSVYKKIYLGLFITVLAYAIGMFIEFPLLISSQITGIIIWFALIGLQFVLYRKLATASTNTTSSLVIFISYAIIEGLQLSYLVTIFSYIYLGDNITSTYVINLALGISAIATFTITAITGAVASNMKVNDKNLKIMNAIGRVITISVLSIGAFFLIGLVFSLFGNVNILENFYQLYYGTGTIGLLFSVVFVVFASFSLLRSFYTVNVAQKEQVDQSYEFALAALVLTDIVWVYIEVLKLVLKLIARRD